MRKEMAEIRKSKPNALNISLFDSARGNHTSIYEIEQINYIQDKLNETTYATANQNS